MRSRIVISLMLLGLGAGCGGTEAGNPSVVATTSGISPVSQPTTSPSSSLVTVGASQILTALCAKLNACDPTLSLTQCSTELGATSGFGAKLGVASGGPNTLNAITAAEESGQLTSSSAAVTRCDLDISALSCSAVTSAYHTSTPQDFSQVPSLIPTSSTSCPGVY